MLYITLLLFAIISSNSIYTQTNTPLNTIEITEDQTTHLIFPSNISYVDLGNSQFFITDYTDNILRIKGQQQQPTNLTVITQNQFYYSFLVKYTRQPQLNYFIETHQSLKNLGHQALQQQMTYQPLPVRNSTKNSPRTKIIPSERLASTDRNNDFRNGSSNTLPYEQNFQRITHTAQKILDNKPLPLLINNHHGDIKLKVTGVYHSLQHCYIKYEIQNSGAIPYDVSYTEFGIRDKQRPKRTAIHETILNPIFILQGDRKRLLPFRINRYVAYLKKLTFSIIKIVTWKTLSRAATYMSTFLFIVLKLKR